MRILIGIMSLFFLINHTRADISNPSLTEYYHLGGYYLQVGQPDKAINNYRDMINKYPDSNQAQQAWLSIGDAYLKIARSQPGTPEQVRARSKNYLDKAAEAYRNALSRFPAVAGLARLKLGKLYVFDLEGEADTGRTWLQSVIRDYPEQAGKAALVLAQSLKQDGQSEKAFQSYQSARITFPEIATLAVLKQAQILYLAEDYSGATVLYTEVANSMALDGYFNGNQYSGTTLKEAEEGIRNSALKEGNPKFALEVISSLNQNYSGTNAEMIGRIQKAKLLFEQGKLELAVQILDSIYFEYTQSLYGPRALFEKARMLEGKPRVEVYDKVRETWPQSIYWVEATMHQVSHYLTPQNNSDTTQRVANKKKAQLLLKQIISRYPASPEAAKARELLQTTAR